MLSILKRMSRLAMVAAIGVFSLTSCEYQEIADGDYYDQKIYLPAAVYNPFMIDAVPAAIGSSPTPGYPERFKVEVDNNKFNVLLGVYRSGVDNKGAFNVEIALNNDTITSLLATPGALPAGTVALPADQFTVPASIEVKDGEVVGKFNLEAKLDFLRNNAPAGKYAVAVSITSSQREVNTKLSTAIIVIDTKLLKPVANFTSAADAANTKLIKFTNTSQFGMEYSWDFGDGSAASAEKAPSHTYASSGTFAVKLSVKGVTGTLDAVEITKNVVIP